MAIGIRFNPLSLAKVCFNIRNFIKTRFNTQKPCPYRTKYNGVKFGFYHREELDWLREFDTYIPDDVCLENLINDIADSQYITIITRFFKTEKSFAVPFIGRFYIPPLNDRILKFHDYDTLAALKIDKETFFERHAAFFERLRSEAFLKTSNKAAYYESRTKRFSDILRRGIPQIYGCKE